MPLEKGEVVVHRAYGRGTVTATRMGGRQARVSFGVFTLWLDAHALVPTGTGLRLVGGTSPSPSAQPHRHSTSFEAILRMLGDSRRPPPAPAPFMSGRPAAASTPPAEGAGGGRPRARRDPVWRPNREERPVEDATVLESFRLGIVPASQIVQWTVGREEEVAAIRTFLRDHAEGAVLVEGAYGAGKSHLLRYLEQDAAAAGYAVAAAGFDPSEATAAFPKKAWRRIVRGFRADVDGVPHDFRGFVREVAARPAWRDCLGDHRLLGPFLARVAKGRADETDWDWIEGRSSGEF
ncbi:MAG: ATP-binding protein, partial [Deltaproteobacteria bacterium]|nr:ATP-binding protein [Deltaproteobacteria bacterium]